MRYLQDHDLLSSNAIEAMAHFLVVWSTDPVDVCFVGVDRAPVTLCDAEEKSHRVSKFSCVLAGLASVCLLTSDDLEGKKISCNERVPA